MTGDYKNLLNLKEVVAYAKKNNVNTLKAINALLKTKEFRDKYEEALTIVGFRTPTQGKNSMDIMVIHEFLPEVTGNTLILPAGITTKSGADYDIDKMSLYFKHLDYNGKVIDVIDPLQRQVLKDQAQELENYLTEHYDDFLEAKERKK